MIKSKLRLLPLVLIGSALAGCNATTLAHDHDDVVTTKTVANHNYDGQYEVYGECTWPSYGSAAIIDRHNIWTIKKGILKHKKGRFNITGTVRGDILKVSGTRQSGTETGWFSLSFSGPIDSKLHGSWKNGDCNISLKKVVELVEAVDPSTRQMKINVSSSNPFNMPALLFGGAPSREVSVDIIAPHVNSSKPFAIIIPSSTPDMRSEKFIAKELRANGYNTAVVYSYEGINTGAKLSSKLTSSALLADLVETARDLKHKYGFGANGFIGVGTSRGALAIMKAGLESFRSMYHGADLITHGVALNGPCYERLDDLKMDWDFSLLIANGEDDDSTPVAPCKKMMSLVDDNVKLYIHPNGKHHFFTPEPWQRDYYDENGMHFMNKCSLGLDNEMRASIQKRGTDKWTVLTPKNYKQTVGQCIGRGAHYGGDRNGFDALLKQIELLSN